MESGDDRERVPEDHPDCTDVFEAWKTQFPNEDVLEDRLEYEGASRADIQEAISTRRLGADEPIPEWVEKLDRFVKRIQDQDSAEFQSSGVSQSDGTADRQRAFTAISAAIADAVRTQLPTTVRTELTTSAIDHVLEWFQIRLERRYARLLYVECKTFIADRDRELAFADPETVDKRPTTYYERFVKTLLADGFSELCLDYPVFARLLITQVRQLNEQLVEFVERVRDDTERIADRFNDGRPLGRVTNVKPVSEDTHADGRAVLRVTFESGPTVAYKPRSIEAEAPFYRVLYRLNDHVSLPNFSVLTTLNRGGYGWMEWIEYDECEGFDAVERYYQRAGALTCVAYFLGLTDCQIENVIVDGEHPTLIDTETVFHSALDVGASQTRKYDMIDGTVLLTNLLPYGIDEGTGRKNDRRSTVPTAGFSDSGDEIEIEGSSYPRIRAADTDIMTVESTQATLDRSDNIPAVDGEEQRPSAYLDSIVNGFETTYDTLIQLRNNDRLEDEIGLPHAFESVESRFVFRPTSDYASMLQSPLSWECLRDGAQFSVELERGVLSHERPADHLWSLYEAEREALKRLDPPRFTSTVGGTAIDTTHTSVDVTTTQSGIRRSLRRIESADQTDLRTQRELIRGCFGAAPDPYQTDQPATGRSRTRFTDSRILREATAVFERIREAAYESPTGYHWETVVPRTERERLDVNRIGDSLYSGRPGIALFGAGLYCLTGNSEYREFVHETLRPLSDAVRSDRPVPALQTVGGGVGLGGVAYGLSAAGELLNDESILEDAIRVASRLSTDRIEADETYDVVGGTAGTVLGLLGLWERTGESDLVSAATTCGNHILASRTTARGVQVWETIDGAPPLPGFAHGISGIAYALSRLSAATGNTKYRDAAVDALEYEAETFSATEGNWPDYRTRAKTTYPDQWCYGRSGIGLARLGMKRYVANPVVSKGIKRAVTNSPSSGIHRYDHLCCGEAGRIEFLLEGTNTNHQHTVPRTPRGVLEAVFTRKQETGTYRPLAQTDEIVVPSLFQGLSGVGYTMLRVIAPDVLPSVLLWE